MRSSLTPLLLLLAAALTLLNSAKPLQIDDAAYYYFASNIARQPLDPYGFTIFWYDYPQNANEVLAPPVLPYWWASAIALFGDRPFLWKLWLFPIALLFVVSSHKLFRRFASGLESPLTCMTVLSPTFLPGFNCMLDVPAVALGLAALICFFRACDRSDWRLAALAGLLAGLAMETKYTAFLVPATMVLHVAVCRRNWKSVSLAGLAVAIAVAVFFSWELFTWHKYGNSHFLFHLQFNRRSMIDQVEVFSAPFVVLLGGVAPGLGLLAILALTRRRWPIIVAMLVFSSIYFIVATLGSVEISTHELPIPPEWTAFPLTLEPVIFFAAGLCVVGLTLIAIARLLWQGGRNDWFVCLWLGLEVCGYFAMTPFVAVRRVMGIIVTSTIIVGRLAALMQTTQGHARWVWGIAVWQVALGLLFFSVDLRDAWAGKQAAEEAAGQILARDAAARIWFTGHWGFQFYAERAGMTALVPADPAKPVRKGDWLVIPFEPYEQQRIRLDPDDVECAFHVVIDDWLPFRTVRCYYGSHSGAPLEHQVGPRMLAAIYRVTRGFVPQSS